jgi:hypothetical protein
LQVSGKNQDGRTFAEKTSTLIVNAHGGLILLKEAVAIGQILTIKSVKTDEELSCTVVDINPGANQVPEVGVEFLQANPRFWHVSFPPADWTPRSPEARHFENKPSIPVTAKPTTIKK